MAAADQKIVVYTTIINEYDRLKDPVVTPSNCRFVCFSDLAQNSPVWRTIPANMAIDPDPVRVARRYKIMGFEFFDADLSLYIDGSFQLNADPNQLVKRHLADSDITFFKHPDRSCAYKEAQICRKKKLDLASVISKQVEAYREEKFPERYGLFESGFMLRRRTQLTMQHSALWWAQICAHSRRDQISLPYALWKTHLVATTLPGTRYDTTYATFRGHAKGRVSISDPKKTS